MRKRLLLLVMCAISLFGTLNAQEVTIGTKTTIDARLPFHTWWNYSYSQQIYTSSEINHAAGKISKIAFFTEGTSYTRNVKVYMQNVNKSSFSGISDWISVTDEDLVYEGTVTTSSVMEITLTKEFEYTGKHILLCIQDYTQSGPGGTSYDIYEDDAKRSLFINDDDNLPVPGNESGFNETFWEAKKNVLQITFVAGENPEQPGEGEDPEQPGEGEDPEQPGEGEDPEQPGEGEDPEQPGEGEDPETPAKLDAPKNLRADIRQDVAGFDYKYEITMSWDAVDGAKGYDVYINTADTTGFHMGYTNGTAYVAGANKEATLEFYVVAFNDSIESEPSEVYTITIVDDAVEELNASFNIYPNPVNDNLFIETEMEVLEVSVYDVYGRQQSTVNGQQSLSIDVNGLNSGIYFVKVVTSEGEIVKRFVKK